MGINSIKSKILSPSDLKKVREIHRNKKIVFTAGSFDIIHSGHAIYFNKCKSFGDILVVGVGRDSVIKKLKGNNRPINPEQNRLFMVASLEDVDYALLDDDTPETLDSAELDYINNLSLLNPDYFCINYDNPRLELNKLAVEKLGVKCIVMERDLPENLIPISTTKIIEKLKQ